MNNSDTIAFPEGTNPDHQARVFFTRCYECGNPIRNVVRSSIRSIAPYGCNRMVDDVNDVPELDLCSWCEDHL